jgi:hypothetical protein
VRTPSTVTRAAAAVTLGVALLAGCTSDDADSEGARGDGEVSGAADDVATVTTISNLAGKLGETERRRLKSEVAAVVDGFLDEAYLGEFPREDFTPAYREFTSGARTSARDDADLLSNQPLSGSIEAATALERRVTLEVFAPGRKPRGVLAKFVLDYETAGELEQTERIKGNLSLVRRGERWLVFGYDVIRSVTA